MKELTMTLDPQIAIKRSSKGFTLVELMVVVAVIGILATIAYPSYRDHVNRARRADAQATLMQAAQWMQRYYAANNTFVGANMASAPTAMQVSPRDGTKAYDISTSGVTATSFDLVAIPASTGPMSADRCGSLVLSDTGVKKVTGEGANCWR
jgi:type IV pilus assembly protein PilE